MNRLIKKLTFFILLKKSSNTFSDFEVFKWISQILSNLGATFKYQ